MNHTPYRSAAGRRLGALLAAAALFAVVQPGRLRAQTPPPVYLVFFTHIEDNTPAGTLGTPVSRNNYLLLRSRLIAMADLARSYQIPWTLQSDWKYLRAALLYEDAALMATTNNKNLFRFLKEDRAVHLDPHAHESGAYNYTDVAHLLDSLGVASTTIIGGHVWDPSLPQFAEWDRFRTAQPGRAYPWASWRGDVLMGSGTPNHVNDPLVSGVWHPRDRDHYFEDDPAGNIAAIGQYKGSLNDIAELRAIYLSGAVAWTHMLTTNYHIKPAMLTAAGGLQGIEDTLMTPAAAYRDAGQCVPTDFTSLVQTWRNTFGERGFLYDARAVSGVTTLPAPDPVPVAVTAVTPNPCSTTASIAYALSGATRVRVEIFDARGRRVARLVDAAQSAGTHVVRWDAAGNAGGTYFARVRAIESGSVITRKITVTR